VVASAKAAAQPTLNCVAQRAQTLKSQMNTRLAAVRSKIDAARAQAQAFLAVPPKARLNALSQHAQEIQKKLTDRLDVAGQSLRGGLKTAGDWASDKATQGWTLVGKAKDSVEGRAKAAGNWISDKANQGGTWISKTARQGMDQAKKIEDSVVKGARTAGSWISDKASRGSAWVSGTAKRGLNQAKKAKDSAVSGAKTAGNWISGKAQQGWNAAVRSKDQVIAKVNAVRNSRGFKNMVDNIKAAGIVVAKVGTAIVVGGIVIAGAAALTVATGGLAGPALVAALFASGALGGAAATVVGNALTGKKLGTDISLKSMAIDGALGVVAGPLAKVAGGAVRAVARPVVSGLGRAATAVAPGLSASVRSMASSAGTAATGWAGSAVSGARTYLTGRAAALGSWTAPGRAAIRAAWNPSLAGRATRAVGRGLHRLDTLASAGLRTAARVPQAAGNAMAPAWKTMVRAVRSSSPVRAGRGVLNRLTNRAAVIGYRARNTATQGWAGAKRSAADAERDFRTYLASKGLSVNTSNSLTRNVFTAVDRTLSSMKTYASSQVTQISSEVREQWYGSAGIGGVLRTGRKMEELVASHPTLARAWQSEQRRARKALFNAGMRTVSNEVKAAGTAMSDAARRAVVNSRITSDAVYDYAVRNVSGPFMIRATASYRAGSAVAQTGFDSNSNFIAQLPRVYDAGVRQQIQSVRERGLALRSADSVSGAVSVAGGWLGEEASKAFTTGAANNYKTSPGWRPNVGELSHAGFGEVRNKAGEIVRAADTGLTTQTFGVLAPLTPLNQSVKGIAERSGLKTVTDSYELDDPASVVPDKSKEAHP